MQIYNHPGVLFQTEWSISSTQGFYWPPEKEQKMQIYKPLTVLPTDIQLDWMAGLERAHDTGQGVFRLVGARRTRPQDWQSQRITVHVIDENGFPLPNVQVGFSYSTAEHYIIGPEFTWSPPGPHLAFIAHTQGSGMIDQVQGSAVKEGQPGGVTVYILEPEYPSDVVTGAGMLSDHTGLVLTFQLLRAGVRPLPEWLAEIEQRLAILEAR